jgi:hypothetical protein
MAGLAAEVVASRPSPPKMIAADFMALPLFFFLNYFVLTITILFSGGMDS